MEYARAQDIIPARQGGATADKAQAEAASDTAREGHVSNVAHVQIISGTPQDEVVSHTGRVSHYQPPPRTAPVAATIVPEPCNEPRWDGAELTQNADGDLGNPKSVQNEPASPNAAHEARAESGDPQTFPEYSAPVSPIIGPRLIEDPENTADRSPPVSLTLLASNERDSHFQPTATLPIPPLDDLQGPSLTSTIIRRKPLPESGAFEGLSERGDSSRASKTNKGSHNQVGSWLSEGIAIEEQTVAEAGNPPASDESDLNQTQKQENSDKAVPRLWNPFWLKRSVLLSFGLLFLILLITLVVLYHFSIKNGGLATEKLSNQYYWKYGTTGLLVAIVSIWHQVDYTCKVLAAWGKLKDGSGTADQTVLLDYLSLIAPVVAYKSFKNKEWSVFSGTTASLILDLCVIFSTSLMVLLPVQRHDDSASLSFATEFSAVNCNDSDLPGPALLSWGIQTLGMNYPVGTSKFHAFNTPDLSSGDWQSGTAAVNVSTFFSDFGCIEADVSYFVDVPALYPGQSDPYFEINAKIPGCEIQLRQDADTYAFKSPRTLTAVSNWFPYCYLGGNWGDSGFWALLVTDVASKFGYTTNGSQIISDKNNSVHLTNFSVLLCKPTYWIEEALLELEVSPSSLSANASITKLPESPRGELPDFNASSFSNAVWKSFYQAQKKLPASNVLPSSKGVVQDSDLLFTLMLNKADTTDLSLFLDDSVMKEAANAAFQGIAAQFAHRILSIPASQQIAGNSDYFASRVIVRTFATAILLTSFGLLVILTVIVASNAPRHVMPRRPDCIGSNVALLWASPALRNSLSSLGSSLDNELESALKSERFKSS